MWPINLSAAGLLRLPRPAWVNWAVFDAPWYRTTYAAAADLADKPDDAVLRFYLEIGQGLGHSPNTLFDEVWHLQAYPEVAALVHAGQCASAFDAYCRGGCLSHSPHWLFDEVRYRRKSPDLTDAALAQRGLVNGYDHYLWRGDAEGRGGHPLFDPSTYLANLDPSVADAARAEGSFRHCLRRIDRREPEVATSARFDFVWYLDRYPAARQAVGDGTWRWALEHYLRNDTPTQFDPVPAFSEAWYNTRYEDAAAMVQRGEIRNGFAHFLRHGVPELRSPGETVDLARYAAREDVRRDLAQGRAADAFVHWLTVGAPAGLPSSPPREATATEAQARALFRRRARTLSVLHARVKLDFTVAGVAALSVIMVLHNQFELTMMTLGSLRANYPGAIDLVLIDSGSTDETRHISSHISGATYFRFDTNIGFLLSCNAALQFATADAVLYLNNDIELAPGAIAAALRRLDKDPRIGAVGGMILRSHGLVQEAGNIIYCDGSTQGYGRDFSPLAPEVNFTRDVEFCSAVFLMARRSLLHQLEGFDAAFAPAYYEDTDLCVRIRQAGYRVVYDPAIIVHHLEYGSAESSSAAVERIDRNRAIFAAKHAAYIVDRPPRDERRIMFSRLADTTTRRVLVIDDTVPIRRIGSGFVRSNDIVREMASLGYLVTVYPINGSSFHVASVYADMPDGVEVMHDCSREHFLEFLTLRLDYYDAIWVARTHNIAAVRVALECAMQGRRPDQRPLVVLDTEAIASVREQGQAALEGRYFDFDAAVSAELQNGSFCDTIVAINGSEAAILRDMEFRDVAVIGHARTLHPTPRPFAERAGMLFVGGIHLMDSPNYDSLCWFIDEVLPLISKELTWETRLTVAGFTGATVSLERFCNHPRVTLRGAVDDLTPLYDAHRVFIAPTRFAAGTPYKVHEAASFGLPVVATELLRRQLGWENGRDLLAAEANDPVAFARHVVALQRDETIWRSLRDAALERLRRENNREDYAAAIRGVLGAPVGAILHG